MIGAITQYLDVAQIVLYLFWFFFAGLIYYLHQENKREGYPLESDRSSRVKVQGFPPVPEPKTFLLRDGTTRTAPHNNTGAVADLKATSASGHPAEPLNPTGNPMLDGVGPGAYAIRPDIPDMTVDQQIKIVPLRVAANFHLESSDPNPIGMNVVGGDGAVAGTVTDVWVDRAETMIRYLEVKVAANARIVLVPINFARIGSGRNAAVTVRSIFAKHFADVPGTKRPDSVTLMEEERIMAYYGAGTLYASPDRAEPWL
jgi:photosynthetic reaction center H subunit